MLSPSTRREWIEISLQCCEWCTKIAGRYVYGEEPRDVFRRHDNCGCTVTYENGKQRQDVWSKKSWEAPDIADTQAAPVRFSGKQANDLEQKNLQYKGLTNNGESGIIKSIDIDDFEMMSEGRNIDPKAIEIISSVIKKYENSGEIYINDFYFGSLKPEKNGTPLLQIEPIGDKTLRLNINTDVFSGKTVDEINRMLADTKINLADNLEEAVIHECGHAKALNGLTVNEIKALYAEILDAKITGVSKIAYKDGAEALAEIEVLISRASDIPDEAMNFYNKYMRRKSL